jgi:hypothetical protein
MDPASFRVRSSRCEAPKGMDFAATMADRLRTGGALAAE